jgi:PIN domain nuclease of toxin-antitoxin system
VNLLLDTHVALWAITDSDRLKPDARRFITAERAGVWVSVVSVWEIAIKHALGRGDMPVSGKDAVHYFRASGFKLLAIQAEHTLGVEDVPLIHSDPFDRLLVAQALLEPMRLLTRDAAVAQYSDSIVLV